MRPALVLALLTSLGSAHAQPGATGAAPVCRAADPATKITARFKAGASLRDLVTWVAGFTCKSIVYPAAVERQAQALNLVVPGPLTPAQALALFVEAARSAGVIATVKADVITLAIDPAASTKCVEVAPPPSEDTLGIEGGIQLVDPTHARITRALMDRFLGNPMDIAKDARVVPSAKGFKLYALRPSSVHARIGLANGDTIVAVNGSSVASAEKALEVYAKIRDAKQLVLELERRGKPMTLTIDIVEKL